MPTREAIVSTVLPQEVQKPIPVRTISTRTAARVNLNQQSSGVDPAAADSATPVESVKLSPQLTALARQKEAVRRGEQALKQREKELEARLAEADQYSQLKTKLGAKDYSAAEALGLSYEDYTKFLLEKQAGEDPNTLAFRKLEGEIQALKKGQEDKAAQEYEETVAAYKTELTSLADTDPAFAKVKMFKDTDEKGKEYSGVDVALNLIIDSWNEDQTELTVEQALKDTDIYLKEQAKKWLALGEEPVQEEVEARALPPPKVGSRTLTQQMQPAGITKQPVKSLQHLSESERYEEARRRVIARRQQEGR